ncbi:MAG: hypothetical protein LQ338_001790 [Usnochroma carphineum]|nr:MAG: hypothetical protein LQ338_001790 [Usnochroma carphineum]
MDDSDGPLPVRKSGRQRQPNKKYSGDEIIDLHILDSASEEEAEIWQRLAESSNDEDFDAIQAAEGVNDPEEDDISSATAASDGSGIVTPHEDSDDTVSSASINATPAREEGAFATSHRASDYHYTYRKRKKLDAGTHSRGIADPIGSYAKGAKRDYLYSLFGDAIQDVVHASKSRDQWSEDVTLPRRPNRNGNRGMRHLFSHDDEKRRMEATDGWDWKESITYHNRLTPTVLSSWVLTVDNHVSTFQCFSRCLLMKLGNMPVNITVAKSMMQNPQLPIS